jgi:hypothetical protein
MQRLARRDALARLKASTELTALVPAAQIHSQQPLTPPTWPFVKLGQSQTLTSFAACADISDVAFTVHAFAREKQNANGAISETAEDHASAIGKAIEAALARAGGSLPSGGHIRYRLSDIRLAGDAGEPGAFHWSAQVNARVISVPA